MKRIKRPDVYRRLRARRFTAKKARRIANGNRRAFRLQPSQWRNLPPGLPSGHRWRFLGSAQSIRYGSLRAMGGRLYWAPGGEAD